MPHLFFEHSANLPAVDFPSLALPLHEILAEKAGARLGDCKSRWRRTDDFLVGNDESEQAFLHLAIDLLAGRPQAVLLEIGKAALEALGTAVRAQIGDQPELDEIQISVEVREMSREGYFKELIELPLV